jgi:hypothetical protein
MIVEALKCWEVGVKKKYLGAFFGTCFTIQTVHNLEISIGETPASDYVFLFVEMN